MIENKWKRGSSECQESPVKRNERKGCKFWGKSTEIILLKIWELGVIQRPRQREGIQAKNAKVGRDPLEKYWIMVNK